MIEHRRASGLALDLDFDQKSTLARFAQYVGQTCTDHLGNVFVFCVGVASGAKGDWGSLEGSGSTGVFTRGTAAIAQEKHPQLVILCAALGAAEYGWGLLKYERDANGKFGPLVDDLTAADVVLATSGTAGRLKDDGNQGGATVFLGGQRPVRNITLHTAQSGGAGLNTTGSWNFIESGS